MKMKTLKMNPMDKTEGTDYINPFHTDLYHMGTTIGKNVTVMFAKHQNEVHEYVIIANTKTGERLKVYLNPNPIRFVLKKPIRSFKSALRYLIPERLTLETNPRIHAWLWWNF
jgi:hypothetical protein